MAVEQALSALDLVELVGFQHRRAVELGNRETDPELRKRYAEFVKLINQAQQVLEPNYSPIFVIEPVLVDAPCPLCGHTRRVIKCTTEVQHGS